MTMTSLLKNLAGPGKPLRQEAFDAAEYAGLIHSGRVRLTDAQNPVNSLESGFDLAYNAAHALSLANARAKIETWREDYNTVRRIVGSHNPHLRGLDDECRMR